MDDERRQYYRHPIDIPIQVYPQHESAEYAPMSDLSEGGLSFQTNVFIEAGKVLRVRIPYVDPPFDAPCVVCWQRPFENGKGFEVGVMFRDEETAFRIKMVQQVCHIKNYQKQQSKEGRNISFEEASLEWIGKFAADFGRA
ncbi:PilZ domain protein [Mariprofundus micogutta]|uniref:PilZ domain protein n=2 Tax=Mariprofundus micogutta TaxID=1921010 RepID=A0A1L8CPC6_9PROT|nr:PilZ domain protein [Mariprofundus micogutta]